MQKWLCSEIPRCCRLLIAKLHVEMFSGDVDFNICDLFVAVETRDAGVATDLKAVRGKLRHHSNLSPLVNTSLKSASSAT